MIHLKIETRLTNYRMLENSGEHGGGDFGDEGHDFCGGGGNHEPKRL